MPVVSPGRWSEAFSRRDGDLDAFIQAYFPSVAKNTLFVCGTGFDPRARVIADALSPAIGPLCQAWLLREERPSPHPSLTNAADRTTEHVQRNFPKSRIVRFDVFAEDGALAAGSNLARELPLADLEGISDVIIDFSSLSIGVAYPLAAWLSEQTVEGEIKNVHFMIAYDSETDRRLGPRATGDQIHSPQGFRRPSSASPSAAVLWVPQLHRGQSEDLDRIAGDVRPDEIVPLLPFPTRRIREPEELILEYADVLNGWGVDPRNVIYAAENDPLDVYRILVRVARERAQVFKHLGTSEVVLTPMGSKLVAMGALMAALEQQMSVRYVETLEYLPLQDFPEDRQYEKLSVWLNGGPSWTLRI
jgi:hypothetical protein